ncbi:MAG: helix-hairpin-helix domain-containing protein [Acidobacteriia bacterium]|nr:helix-hairpin-helix domain-containing protein [Terriglobia bacterium]
MAFLVLRAEATTKKPPPQPVNINTATADELQQVPGIGPVTAEKIIHMRRAYGRFKRVDDLLSIKGIGRKRLEKMRKYLAVSGPPSAPASAPADKSTPSNEEKAPPAPPSYL